MSARGKHERVHGHHFLTGFLHTVILFRVARGCHIRTVCCNLVDESPHSLVFEVSKGHYQLVFRRLDPSPLCSHGSLIRAQAFAFDRKQIDSSVSRSTAFLQREEGPPAGVVWICRNGSGQPQKPIHVSRTPFHLVDHQQRDDHVSHNANGGPTGGATDELGGMHGSAGRLYQLPGLRPADGASRAVCEQAMNVFNDLGFHL